jgi:hypothetical protein
VKHIIFRGPPGAVLAFGLLAVFHALAENSEKSMGQKMRLISAMVPPYGIRGVV